MFVPLKLETRTLALRFPITIFVPPEAAGQRLDQFLSKQIPNVSRAGVQRLLEDEKATVNGSVAKPSLRLKSGARIAILGNPQPALLRAIAEDIPLDIVHEDDDLAVVNKPAGMMVHAGAGATDTERNRGTLVNALLHRFGALSQLGGGLRPGIVHRLDRETSGLIVVAKNDIAHRKLAKQFACREVKKLYIALVHGWLGQDSGTINSEISRDPVRRTRMTTRRRGGRAAVTHFKVRERITSKFGKFALLEVRIDTGRTHQIRVHLASIGHPVVGDALYGAPRQLRAPTNRERGSVKKISEPRAGRSGARACGDALCLTRNFLHAATIEFTHPQTGQRLSFTAPWPEELVRFLREVRG